jgi:hypothetical protein
LNYQQSYEAGLYMIGQKTEEWLLIGEKERKKEKKNVFIDCKHFFLKNIYFNFTLHVQ